MNQKLPPPSESSMFRVAWSCCEGIRVFSRVPDSNTLIAFAIVAGHGIEATLKCHLLQKGKSLRDCVKLGHDLMETWDAAVAEGPPIEGPVPDWLRALNWGHDRPYAFRYLPDMHGVGAPRADELLGWWDPVLKSLYRTSSRL
jgi:hypothetical protein